MINIGNSVPGLRSDRTYTPRTVLWGDGGNAPNAEYLPGGKILDATNSRDALNTGDLSTLRPGIVLGKVSTTTKYAVSIIGVSTAAAASAATVVTVSAATATEISRRVGTTGNLNLVGGTTAGGTVTQYLASFSAVNTTTGVLTVGALAQAFVTGSLVQANDGSQTPKVILHDHVRLTDADGNAIDGAGGRILIGGAVVASQLINYPADTAIRTWLKSKLNGNSGTVALNAPFVFDDEF